MGAGVRWEDVEADPRYGRLSPEGKLRVRRQFEQETGEVARPRNVPLAPSDWMEQLAPGEEEEMRGAVAGLTPEEKVQEVGLATGRLRRSPEGDVVPRPQGPEPTFVERLEAGAAPAVRAAARLQGYVEYPFKKAGEYVTETTEPYVGETAATVLGGIPEYAPYAGLLALGGGSPGLAARLASSGRLGKVLAAVERAGAAPGARGLVARLLAAGGTFSGVEAEREGMHAIDEGRGGATPEEIEAAAGRGFVGGVTGQAVLGEPIRALTPYAARLIQRLRARGGEAPPETLAPAPAAAAEAVPTEPATPGAGEVAEALRLADQADAAGRPGEATTWRVQAQTIQEDIERVTAASAARPGGPVERMNQEAAARAGMAASSVPRALEPAPLEPPASFLERPPTPPRTEQAMVPGATGARYVGARQAPPPAGDPATVLAQAAEASEQGHLPVPTSTFRVTPTGEAIPPGATTGTPPRTAPPPGEPSGEQMAFRGRVLAARPPERLGDENLPIPSGTMRVTPEGQALPAGAVDARQAAAAMRDAVRRRNGAPEPEPPPSPTRPEPEGLSNEVADLLGGKAPAWMRPAATEGTVPTPGERLMADVDLQAFAQTKGLGYYRGQDGSEVLYRPEQIPAEMLPILDAQGRLAEVVNGPGTAPKPEVPTTAVTARGPGGEEVRTVLTDSPEATAAAAAAQPPGTTVEAVPAEAAIPRLLAEREAAPPGPSLAPGGPPPPEPAVEGGTGARASEVGELASRAASRKDLRAQGYVPMLKKGDMDDLGYRIVGWAKTRDAKDPKSADWLWEYNPRREGLPRFTADVRDEPTIARIERAIGFTPEPEAAPPARRRPLPAAEPEPTAAPEPTLLPMAETPAARTGKTATVSTERFPDLETRYEVAELPDLVASHTIPDFEEHPHFPQELQPRDRSRAGAVAQVSRLAQEIDPRQLAENPLSIAGAPIIGPDNIVESGNGRVMALQMAQQSGEQGRYPAYREWLEQNAERFGLDAAEIRRMDMPVLVRRRLTELAPEERLRFTRAANRSPAAAPTSTETARQDAARLVPTVLDLVQVPESGNFLAPSNREFIRAFARAMEIGPEDNTFWTSGQEPTQAAVSRMRAAILAKVFDKPSTRAVLERMTESADDNVRNLTGAILDAAPDLARLKAGIEGGARPPRDLAPALATAAERISALREEGIPIADYLAQTDLFGRDPLVTDVVRAVGDFGRSRKRLGELLHNYAEVVNDYGDLRQQRMAGIPEPTVPPVRDLFGEAVRRTREESGGQTGLFGPGAPKRGPEQKVAEALRLLDAKIRTADAGGERELAQTLRTERAFLEATGRPLPGGGLGEHTVDRLRELFGPKTDPRITERAIEDYPSAVTYLVNQGFLFRKDPVFRRLSDRLKRGIDEADRMHRILLEREPTPGEPASGGWRIAQRAIPKAERPLFTKAAWKYEAQERVASAEELRADGLGEAGIRAYFAMHRALRIALEHVINPLRRELGMDPLDPIAGYLPHRWFGSYDVHVDGKRVPGSARTKAEAYSWARRILDDPEIGFTAHPDIQVEIVPRFREFMGEMADNVEGRALQALLRRFEKVGTIPREVILDAWKRGVDPQGFPRHFEYRRGAEGFEREALLGESGIIDRYLSELARYAPMRRAREDFRLLLAEIDPTQKPHLYNAAQRLLARVSGRPGQVELMVDDAIRRLPILGQLIDPHRPTMRAVRSTRGTVAQLKLGLGNLSAGLVNGLQFVTNTTPVLGKYAWIGARETLNPSAESARLLGRFEHLGLTNPLFVRGELAEGQGLMHKVLDKLFIPMSAMEQFNRRATLLGAYYRARDMGLKGDRLIQFASEFTRDHLPDLNRNTLMDVARRANELLNFRYDVASRPAWTTGPVGELVGQFRTFTVSQLELQKRLIDLARRGEATPALLHFGAITALSGMLGFPFAYLIDQVATSLLGHSPIDALTDRLPPWATRGLPALVGMDISRRVGMGDIAPMEATDVFGPAVSTLLSVISEIRQGDFDMLGRRLAPGPGSWYTFWRLYSDGVDREPNTRERMRYTPDSSDLLMRALGLQPIEATTLQDVVRSSRRAAERFKTQKAEYVDQAVASRARGDHVHVFEILHEAEQAGIPITFRDILDEEKKKGQPTLQRLREQMPKAIRPEFDVRAEPHMERERRLGAARLVERLRAAGSPR